MASVSRSWSTPNGYTEHIKDLQYPAKEKGIAELLNILEPLIKPDADNQQKRCYTFNTISYEFRQKSLECLCCVHLIFEAGFSIPDNNRCRMVFSGDNLDSVYTVIEFLKSISNTNNQDAFDKYNQYKQTHSDGIKAECFGDISSGNCDHCLFLVGLLNKYHLCKEDEIVEPIQDELEILNAFVHFLLYHNRNDNDIQYMYSSIRVCNKNQCGGISRYYDRDSNTIYNEMNCKELMLRHILDKVHCHFVHCYEIAPRLTADEENKINKQNISENDKLIQRRKILKAKQIRKIGNYNKFCSNLNKSTRAINDVKHYSYSFKFYYWDHYKNNKNTKHKFDGFGLHELYIPPKYNNPKEELLTNNIMCIRYSEYHRIYHDAELHLQTDYGRGIRADVDDYQHPEVKNSELYIKNYKIREGAPLSVEHLLCVSIYCALTEFQAKFSETYRMKDDEDFIDLKLKHSEFHHMGRLMRETVECFGTYTAFGNVQTFFHGIDDIMYFESTTADIKGIMSTTSEFGVALNFATNEGMVIEMVPHTCLKYFSCCWFSEYEYEMELLFVGAEYPINFIDVIHCSIGCSFKPAITAIRLIETFGKGWYFDEDGQVSYKTIQNNMCFDVELLKLEQLSSKTQILVIDLINHELHRYQPEKYKEFNNLDAYIEGLLHYICINKQEIEIDLESLNVKSKKQIEVRMDWGYIGYEFLSDLFLCKDNDAVNLKIIYSLFPQISYIKLINLSSQQYDIMCKQHFGFCSITPSHTNEDENRVLLFEILK